jgi:hypothetical protein
MRPFLRRRAVAAGVCGSWRQQRRWRLAVRLEWRSRAGGVRD